MRIAHKILSAVVLAFLLFVLTAYPADGQDNNVLRKRLTNEDIIDMVKMGLSDEVIISKIRAASAAGADAISMNTSVEGLRDLKAANVPDSVIKVMINPAPPLSPVIAASTPMTLDPNFPPPEIGVYWKDGANFVLLQGQAVANAKVGGKAGSLFTNGLRNQHWDAFLEGPTSKNVVRDRRPIFYLYVPEGTDSSDYVLINLNKKGDHREFEIGSFGGVTGGKSGVKRDKKVPFRAEHVGIRTYKLVVDDALRPGEYAFFMGTGQSSTMSGATGGNRSGGAAAGRVYDFSVSQ
jgi:hypothetical protein